MTIVPRVDTPRALAGWLARRQRVPAAALAAACREVEERPLAYPLRADDAATIAVAAGLAPLLARTVAREDVAAELGRVAHLGLLSHVAAVAGGARVYLGHEAWRLHEAARAEAALDPVMAGAAFGLPSCCVSAYGAHVGPRTPAAVLAANYGQVRHAGSALLNCVDPRVFHYVPWLPCGPACFHARGFAADVRAHVGSDLAKHVAGLPAGFEMGPFVAGVDRALAAHRLHVLPGVQLSIVGEVAALGVTVRHAWATAIDRHPGFASADGEVEATARLMLRLAGVGQVRVEGEAVLFDSEVVARAPQAFLARFAA